jgi:proteic killer suppression protein
VFHWPACDHRDLEISPTESGFNRLISETTAESTPAAGFSCIDFYKQIVYTFHMITSFANKETEKLFATGKSRKLPPEIIARAIMRLTQLDSVREVTDLLMPPSNRLEALSGNRAGQWSIRINDQWRICFSFANGEATEVEITDYH